MKVIPAIDIMGGQVVRLLKGDPKNKTVYSDDPADIAKRWEAEGADMLHVVDLDATLQRGSNYKIIKEIAGQISVPIQVAGGLRSREIIEDALGVSPRIVVGTIAFRDRGLLDGVAEKFGKERLVISVDHDNGTVMTHGWQQSAGVGMLDAVRDFAGRGFSEFLVTNVSRDGTLGGPDLDGLRAACRVPGIHVIASGGISNSSDVARVKECGAYGVILGKAMYDGKVSIGEAKDLA